MKAVVCTKYGAPDVLQVMDVEKPVPKDNEVLIRVYAVVATPSDCAFRKGEPVVVRVFTGLSKPKQPIPGDLLAGEIEAVGERVTRFKKGDRVLGSTGTAFAAHAEYSCVPEDGGLAIMPANMTFDDAAAICDGGMTALPFIEEKAHAGSGMSILINGASGSLGTFAVQLAKGFGASVTGVCSTANLELVRSLGADRVIDYTQEDFTTSGGTYDVVFDAVAKSSFSRCAGLLNPGGLYLTTFPTPAVLLRMLWTSVRGGKRAMFVATGMRTTAEKQRDLHRLNELYEAGKIKAVIDRRYPPEQMAEAHRYVEQGHKKGSVVITFGDRE